MIVLDVLGVGDWGMDLVVGLPFSETWGGSGALIVLDVLGVGDWGMDLVVGLPFSETWGGSGALIVLDVLGVGDWGMDLVVGFSPSPLIRVSSLSTGDPSAVEIVYIVNVCCGLTMVQ